MIKMPRWVYSSIAILLFTKLNFIDYQKGNREQLLSCIGWHVGAHLIGVVFLHNAVSVCIHVQRDLCVTDTGLFVQIFQRVVLMTEQLLLDCKTVYTCRVSSVVLSFRFKSCFPCLLLFCSNCPLSFEKLYFLPRCFLFVWLSAPPLIVSTCSPFPHVFKPVYLCLVSDRLVSCLVLIILDSVVFCPGLLLMHRCDFVLYFVQVFFQQSCYFLFFINPFDCPEHWSRAFGSCFLSRDNTMSVYFNQLQISTVFMTVFNGI